MSGFLTNLNQHFDSFTHSQKLTANYLTDHMTEFAFSTLEGLSEKNKCQYDDDYPFLQSIGI